MSPRTRLITGLVLFMVLDIVIPLPLLGVVLLVVVLTRPPWFLAMVRTVYEKRG